MAPIDWSNLSGVAVGACIGTLIGYYVMRNRPLAFGRKRSLEVDVLRQPARHAVLIALAAFAGCAIADDIADPLGRREQPGGYFLEKYIFALAIGVVNYVTLRRRGRLVGAGVHEV